MNLQINSPYRPCPHKCPYCIASYVDNSPYKDTADSSLFYIDKDRYFDNLNEILSTGLYTSAVITGSTEPTLFRDWMDEVVQWLADNTSLRTEVTTRDSSYEGNSSLYAVSYSLDRFPLRDFWSSAEHTRYVYILHKGITIDEIIWSHRKRIYIDYFAQTTVKKLQLNSHSKTEVDNWIKNNIYIPTDEDLRLLKENGIWYDDSCNISENRYRVFRADGLLYEDWMNTKPLELTDKR